MESIKKILFFITLLITINTFSQNYSFQLLGDIMTKKEFRRYDYKLGDRIRKYRERKLNNLIEKGNLDFLKKIAIFKFQDFYYGNKKDTKKGDSFAWFKGAASLGDKESKYNLGIFYLLGYGVNINYNAAITIFKDLEKANFKPAQELLGYIYYQGFGLEKDIDLGSYLLLSNEDNLIQPFVKTKLGKIYLDGNNTQKDTIKAVTHLYKTIRFYYSQDILLDLLYSKSKNKVIKKLTELEGNQNQILCYIFKEVVKRKPTELKPAIFYDYSRVILRSPYKTRTWDDTELAINYYKKYKDEVSYASNEDDWYYGHNLYYKNYLRGDIYLAEKGVDAMKNAALKDHKFARELTNIYRNSAYRHIRNPKEATFWELKANLYESKDVEVSKVLALATGNGVNKDIRKAYELAKIGYERRNPSDKDYDSFYYLYFTLCRKANIDSSQHCTELEHSYIEYIYCHACNTTGKVTCLSCNGSGSRLTYRSNTEQCKSCNGFGYKTCQTNINMPKNYILEAFPIK